MRDARGGARRRQGRLAAGRHPHAVGRAVRRARAARAASQAHEARWLNLCGFLLRPGFGHELDDWRIQQLWKLYSQGLRFPRATQCRVEWWGLWKRIAGGLSRAQQQELFNQTAPFLLPRLKARQGRSAPRSDRRRCASTGSCWPAASACAPSSKAELGDVLLPAVAKGKATEAEIWALGRLGARAPFAGPLNCVVPRAHRRAVGRRRCSTARLAARRRRTSFALVQLARCVGDRERDLDESSAPPPRRRACARCRTASAPRGWSPSRCRSRARSARASSTSRCPSA